MERTRLDRGGGRRRTAHRVDRRSARDRRRCAGAGPPSQRVHRHGGWFVAAPSRSAPQAAGGRSRPSPSVEDPSPRLHPLRCGALADPRHRCHRPDEGRAVGARRAIRRTPRRTASSRNPDPARVVAGSTGVDRHRAVVASADDRHLVAALHPSGALPASLLFRVAPRASSVRRNLGPYLVVGPSTAWV